MTAVENKIPDVSSLVTKTDYAPEITKIKTDYVTNATLNDRHKDIKNNIKNEYKNIKKEYKKRILTLN